MADKVFYSFNNTKCEVGNEIDNIKNIHSGQILNPELLDSIDSLNLLENKKQKVLVM
jgi:hypothetical protein